MKTVSAPAPAGSRFQTTGLTSVSLRHLLHAHYTEYIDRPISRAYREGSLSSNRSRAYFCGGHKMRTVSGTSCPWRAGSLFDGDRCRGASWLATGARVAATQRRHRGHGAARHADLTGSAGEEGRKGGRRVRTDPRRRLMQSRS